MTGYEGRRGKFILLSVGLACGVAALAGCGGGSSKSSGNGATPQSAATDAGTTTTSRATSTTTNPFAAFTNSLALGKGSTFKAVYTGISGGRSVTLTLEQRPPDSLLATAEGTVISTGNETYLCSAQQGQKECFAVAGANPLASLTEIFNPTSINAALLRAESVNANLSYSTGTYGGVASKCADFSNLAVTGKYCVGDNGVITYISAPGATFSLTSFTTSVSSSDFTVPSGSSTVTLPSGITLPTLLPSGA